MIGAVTMDVFLAGGRAGGAGGLSLDRALISS